MKDKNSFRIVKQGKKQYLEFLRNLTPQILLFTFVLLIGRKLDFSVIDFSNWLQTFLFYLFCLAFGTAFYCNCALLFETCYSDLGAWADKISAKAEFTNRRGFGRLWFLLVAVYRKRLIPVIEALLVIVFLQVALAVVVFMAIPSAVNILKMGG